MIFIIFIFIAAYIQSCKKDKEKSPIIETGTLTDIDGNIYKTVKIGEQWWMAENLKTTRYSDGSYLARSVSLLDTVNWKIRGTYCTYDNDDKAPGLLYNWYAIQNSSGIAPEGWHVPTDTDWKTLEMELGMDYSGTDSIFWRGKDIGDKLKEIGSKYWYQYENIWNSNKSGFSAMAGGCRTFNNQWSLPYGLNYMGFWWSSTTFTNNLAWFRYLDYKSSGICRYYGPLTYGFSIRCVKN